MEAASVLERQVNPTGMVVTLKTPPEVGKSSPQSSYHDDIQLHTSEGHGSTSNVLPSSVSLPNKFCTKIGFKEKDNIFRSSSGVIDVSESRKTNIHEVGTTFEGDEKNKHNFNTIKTVIDDTSLLSSNKINSDALHDASCLLHKESSLTGYKKSKSKKKSLDKLDSSKIKNQEEIVEGVVSEKRQDLEHATFPSVSKSWNEFTGAHKHDSEQAMPHLKSKKNIKHPVVSSSNPLNVLESEDKKSKTIQVTGIDPHHSDLLSDSPTLGSKIENSRKKKRQKQTDNQLLLKTQAVKCEEPLAFQQISEIANITGPVTDIGNQRNEKQSDKSIDILKQECLHDFQSYSSVLNVKSPCDNNENKYNICEEQKNETSDIIEEFSHKFQASSSRVDDLEKTEKEARHDKLEKKSKPDKQESGAVEIVEGINAEELKDLKVLEPNLFENSGEIVDSKFTSFNNRKELMERNVDTLTHCNVLKTETGIDYILEKRKKKRNVKAKLSDSFSKSTYVSTSKMEPKIKTGKKESPFTSNEIERVLCNADKKFSDAPLNDKDEEKLIEIQKDENDLIEIPASLKIETDELKLVVESSSDGVDPKSISELNLNIAHSASKGIEKLDEFSIDSVPEASEFPYVHYKDQECVANTTQMEDINILENSGRDNSNMEIIKTERELGIGILSCIDIEVNVEEGDKSTVITSDELHSKLENEKDMTSIQEKLEFILEEKEIINESIRECKVETLVNLDVHEIEDSLHSIGLTDSLYLANQDKIIEAKFDLDSLCPVEDPTDSKSEQFIKMKEVESILGDKVCCKDSLEKSDQESKQSKLNEVTETTEQRKVKRERIRRNKGGIENLEGKGKDTKIKASSVSLMQNETQLESDSSDEFIVKLPETKIVQRLQKKKKFGYKKNEEESFVGGERFDNTKLTSSSSKVNVDKSHYEEDKSEYETCSEKKSDSSVESFPLLVGRNKEEEEDPNGNSTQEVRSWSSVVKKSIFSVPQPPPLRQGNSTEDKDSIYESCNDEEFPPQEQSGNEGLAFESSKEDFEDPVEKNESSSSNSDEKANLEEGRDSSSAQQQQQTSKKSRRPKKKKR